MTTPLLELTDISVSFGGLHVLRSVQLSVPAGDRLGVVGPNGAGKTTLFNVISGVTAASSGEVKLAGHRLNGLRPERRAGLGLTRTFQNLALFDHLTVRENVLIGTQASFPRRADKLLVGALLGRRSRAESAAVDATEAALELLGLGPQADRLVSELAFGDRRRTDLARAIAARPRLILLDEPFSGLAVGERPGLADSIDRACSQTGVDVILVEHDVAVVRRMCDQVAILNEGTILAVGEPGQTLARQDVREAYIGPALARRGAS